MRITLFPRIFEANKLLWVPAWIFHVSLILLLFGHLRLFQEPYWLWNILGLKTYEDVSRFALIAGKEISPSPIPKRVTYHDPCRIARNSGIIEESRYVLKRTVKDFVKMNPSKNRN